jgi:photosystem II stability/assembly factor-like uncharacterized protein
MIRRWGFLVVFIAAACSSSTASRRPQPRPAPIPDRVVDRDGDARLEREEWFFRRLRGDDGRVPMDGFARGVRRWKAWAAGHRSLSLNGSFKSAEAESIFGSRTWQEIGPRNIAGRVLSVASDPQDPRIIWAGSAGGGLWRSADFGQTWKQMGGDRLPSLWISAIAVDPKNSQTVYMGTGETNTNFGGYGGFGGMLKTTDGGRTFKAIQLPDYGFFRTIVSSSNSDLILTSGYFGLYRSTDAGAHFTLTLTDSITDFGQDPKNPSRFLAVRSGGFGNPRSGLFESLDSGLTWRPLGVGLPAAAEWGRSAVAFSPAPSGVVYLAIGQKIGGTFTPTLFRSLDDGHTWSSLIAEGQSGYNGVGWYGAHIYVAPFDSKLIAQANGGSILLSRDGGLTWARPGGDWHADTHGFAFHPLDPTRMVLATDGGVAVSADGGNTFKPVNRGFPTVQFYSCAIGLADSSTVLAGTQDNWMTVYRGAPGGAWEYSYPPGVGDVGSITINPLSPNQMSTVTAAAADIGYSTDAGRTWAPTRQNGIPADESAPWAARMGRSVLHPDWVYLGGRRLEASTDSGQSWHPIVIRPALQAVIVDVAISPTDDREIWTLWSDGKVFVSEDTGATWREHSPPTGDRGGSRISAGPVKGTAYVALSGTEGPRLFRTGNGGNSWVDISQDLPDLPINQVLADPRRAGSLVVATDAGVAFSDSDGNDWQDVSGDLPRTVIFDLCLDPGSGRLAAATYGRGLWELKASTACSANATTLCLNDDRFEVKATWATATASGDAQVARLTPDTGYLYFFDPSNVEAVIKLIDGCGFNTNFWVFAGGLTDVRTVITVRDTRTGAVKTYTNPQGRPFQPIQDTSAFSTCDAASVQAAAQKAQEAPTPPTSPLPDERLVSGTSLLLNNGRFKLDVTWRTGDGKSGTAIPVYLTNDTGYFWFFGSSNVELVIKVLKGCALNNSYWVFAGGLTDVQTTLTVTDTVTGKVKTYINPQGTPFQPVQDTSAFTACP